MHDILSDSDMIAYLSMMAIRLIELRRVLSTQEAYTYTVTRRPAIILSYSWMRCLARRTF